MLSLSTSGKYILNGDGEPVPEEDLFTWARWFEHADSARHVGYDLLEDGIWVSTVFTALDLGHHWIDKDPDYQPILWETMVFDKDRNVLHQERYSSRAEAELGHKFAVSRFKHAVHRGSSEREQGTPAPGSGSPEPGSRDPQSA